MSYTKTNWVNNTTPINETNLNKIEQGIYDNSLITEAIADKLNPTDTETYKTAELTEGQITDVIGVGDIVIKGDTEQDGTPTPSAPVNVNVVSGSNVINTSNKNLLSLPNGTYSYNNVTAIVNKGIITINGTPSSTPTLVQIPLTQPIKLKQNDRIKINGNNSNGIGTSSNFVSFRLSGTVNGVSNDNITEILCTNANANKTFTATNDTIINKVTIRGNSNVTFNNFVIKPQIELGTTTTTYEPHQGKELPLDLPVENLAELENGSLWDNNGTERDLDNSVRTKFISFESSMTILPKIFTSLNTRYLQYILYDSNKSFISLNNFTDATAITTSDTNVKYIRFKMTGPVNGTMTINDINFMVVKGNTIPNAYTPYGTTPIELCKIGDYQDYFYKSGSKWYLHKEIGKDVVDENNNIVIANTNASNWYYRISPKQAVSTASQTNQFCNYYPNSEIFNGNTNQGIMKISGGGEIRIRYGTEDTVANFKTWLASNNIALYSILVTATDTEITGTLKEQLEAIYNAPLYEQTNITQTNNDLPMVLDITAYKDNINGIKAFIRK